MDTDAYSPYLRGNDAKGLSPSSRQVLNAAWERKNLLVKTN